MKSRLAFLNGLLIGGLVTGWIVGTFAVIVHEGDETRIEALESSIGKITRAFDLAIDERTSDWRVHRAKSGH